MYALVIAVSAIVVLVIGWYLFENRWDRSQFRRGDENDFVINLRAKKAAKVVQETPGILLIDVRPAKSYETEHIPGAINTPFVDDVLDESALNEITRERPILVYCDGGYRSRKALNAMRQAGFRRIYHLHRGIMSWKLAEEPTESTSTP